MDLLGSIMGKMTGPPTATEKQKAERKKARELAQVTRLDSTYVMDDDFLVVYMYYNGGGGGHLFAFL